MFAEVLLGTKIVPIIVALLVLILLIKVCLVKAPPNKVIVISGFRAKPRMIRGKVGFMIPLLERSDSLEIGVININIDTEDYIPTKDFINVKVNAIAQVSVDLSDAGIQVAIRNFLNKTPDEIRKMITESMQGNLREVIGAIDLKALSQDKAKFSAMVKDTAQDDMANLGLTIKSFNVQNVTDADDLIKDLGIDNREQIRKDASIAKANAKKEIEIAEANALNEANKIKVQSDTEIANRNNILAIKKSQLKVSEDMEKAKADLTYETQTQESRKELEIATQEAEIAKREKEIELQSREAEVAEKRLDAEVRKKAEAEKYAAQQKADAELYKRQKEAEAELFEQEKKAEAIRKTGLAEADAIKAKGDAEAAAMDKKAEAMKKYGQAAILEMIVGVLPEMAKAVAEPISSIDKVSIIGGNSDGISDVAGNVPVMLAKVMESVKETTGIDMMEIVKANTYDAKVNKNITLEDNRDVVETTEEK